ncbi:MAG: hypothetical protein LBL41_00170 [Bifidobacteriaceae bacterium]|jgi:dihydrofolate synthase/folylpolyglutamate synthase|nr:hypothetical protein [Bifidobacteriaceae bacterium]
MESTNFTTAYNEIIAHPIVPLEGTKLQSIHHALNILNHPEQGMEFIHVAGTNGKTSVATRIDAYLHATGLKTGLFISPHVQSPTERICINSEPISEQDFVQYFGAVKEALVPENAFDVLGFFDIFFLMALLAYRDSDVDVAVIETGIGGLHDSTNVINAKTAVITHIDIDHANILGNTLAQIAHQKAGIIKEGAKVFSSAQVAEVKAVIDEIAKYKHTGGRYVIKSDFFPNTNDVLAKTVAESYIGRGLTSSEAITANTLVRLPGKFETLPNNILLDSAHNPDGARALCQALSERKVGADSLFIGVVSISRDKDASGILKALHPIFTKVILTENSSERATLANKLHDIALQHYDATQIIVEPDFKRALNIAKSEQAKLGKNAWIVVTGSVMTAGEARELIVNNE